MTSVIGPTVPRWRLGERLQQLRRESGHSAEDAARELGCTPEKIRRIEQGKVGLSRPDLRVLIELYGAEQVDADLLRELQELGRRRGWWSTHGQIVTPSFGIFLGLESAATRIRAWEQALIPGLLQTEDYFRAILMAQRAEPDVIDRSVQVLRDRQEKIWAGSPEMWCLLDEAVLRRPIGGAGVMRAQLARLTETPAVIQVVPYSVGAHAGLPGAAYLFHFPAELHSPIGYVESQAGNLYLEEDDTTRIGLMMDHLTASALSPALSLDMIRGSIDEGTSS